MSIVYAQCVNPSRHGRHFPSYTSQADYSICNGSSGFCAFRGCDDDATTVAENRPVCALHADFLKRIVSAPLPVRAEETKPAVDRVKALAERAGCEAWQVELVVRTVMSQPEAWGI